ncbi:MAG: hypothetical protein H6714_02955 [Myxococcales bacterium]|nr:hypothetical protein [Myxococcales bacterium]
MKSSRAWWIAGCLSVLVVGTGACDDSSGIKDAGVDSASDVGDDSLIVGDADLVEDGGIIAHCGPKGQCEEDELCVYPKCGGCADNGPSPRLTCPAPYCLSVKDATCTTCGGCFEDDPCRGRGECQRILAKHVICGCPRDMTR